MNEKQWQAYNDIRRLLRFLRRSYKAARTKVGRRKLRLFGCACCRSMIWHIAVDEEYRQLVDVAERFADGSIEKKELASRRAACQSLHSLRYFGKNQGIAYASWAMFRTIDDSPAKAAADSSWQCRTALNRGNLKPTKQEQLSRNQRCCGLLRDIFGNPFSPVSIDPSCLAWENGRVVQFAKMIYVERSFECMPVLGDALEDSGCHDKEILRHCRESGKHARGCWVVDLLLGKG